MSDCPYSYFTYRARTGDTYGALAARFSVGERVLRELNDQVPVLPDQPVKIPCALGGCTKGAFYTIQKGDTLKRIARRSHVPMDVLLAANPYLNPAYYIPGQVIVIPSAPPRDVTTYYTLRAGEGVFDVLRKFDMDLTTFSALNSGIDPMHIGQGQRVAVIQNQKSRAAARWYAVQPGDTVSVIANKFGIKVAQLLAANENIRPSEYVPGIRVCIPSVRAT